MFLYKFSEKILQLQRNRQKKEYLKSRQKVAMIGKWDVLFTKSSLCIKLSTLAILSQYCSFKMCAIELKLIIWLINLEWNHTSDFCMYLKWILQVFNDFKKRLIEIPCFPKWPKVTIIWLFLDKVNDQQWQCEI